MSDSETKSEIKSLLISGTGVAAVSVTGYILAFNYERGYADFFGIPIRLIKLNLITILMVVSGLFLVFLLVMWCISIVYPFLPKKYSSPIYQKLLGMFPFYVIFLCLLIMYGATRWFWLAVTPFLIFYTPWLLYEFISPLLLYRQKGTYLEKLEAHESMKNHNKSSYYFQLSKPKDLSLFLVLCIVTLMLFAHELGKSEAIRKKNFLVLNERKDTVVLRIYDDKYICAPFNRETKQVDRSLIILESSGQNELRLNWEKVGPLILADKEEKE